MRTVWRLLVALAGVAGLMGNGITALYAQSVEFGITPGELELVPAPGGTASGVLVVYNKSSRRLHFRVKLEDIYLRPSGDMDVLSPGTLSWSVASLSRLAPTEFDLEPNQQVPVRVVVTVPADLRGGRYGVIVVSPLPIIQVSTGARGTVSMIAPHLAAKLLVPIRGTEVVRGSIINMLAAARSGGKGVDVKVVFRNSGNVHVRASGDVTIINTGGQPLGKAHLPEALVLPGTTREFKLFWDAIVPPGAYTGHVVMDYGGDVLVSGEVSFTSR